LHRSADLQKTLLTDDYDRCVTEITSIGGEAPAARSRGPTLTEVTRVLCPATGLVYRPRRRGQCAAGVRVTPVEALMALIPLALGSRFQLPSIARISPCGSEMNRGNDSRGARREEEDR
jgi:hypothetical protein